jgi:hypothetical protein
MNRQANESLCGIGRSSISRQCNCRRLRKNSTDFLFGFLIYTDCSIFLMVFAHGTTYPDSTYAINSLNPVPSMKLSGAWSVFDNHVGNQTS